MAEAFALLPTVAAADEVTLSTPGDRPRSTVMWSVVVDGRVFVRSFRGVTALWYRDAVAQRAGSLRSQVGSVDIRIVDGDPALADAIDAEYLAKYDGSEYARVMTESPIRETTLELVAR